MVGCRMSLLQILAVEAGDEDLALLVVDEEGADHPVLLRGLEMGLDGCKVCVCI
jgi:hypothetical protein